MWYLSRTGVTEGPFNEAVVLDMIRSGLAEDGHICVVGGAEWVRLGSHPAFGDALQERAVRRSAPPPSTQASTPQAPQPELRSTAPMTPMAPPAQMPMAQPALPAYAPMPGYTPAAGPASYGAQAPSYPPAGTQGSHGGQTPSYPPAAGPSNGVPMPGYTPAAGPVSNGVPMPYGTPSYFTGAPAVSQGEKSKVGLILGVIGAVVVLLAVGGGVAFTLFFRAPPPLAQYYPDNTEVFVEAPNLKKALLGLSQVDIVDGSRVDQKKALDDAQASVARAFDLTPADAARVAMGIGAIAVGARDVEHKGSMAVMIAWTDAKAAETLLASSRFALAGDAGKGGKRYGIKRRELTPEQRTSAGMVENGLSELKLDAQNKEDQLLWFPAKKLLVLANERGASEAIDLVDGTNKKSLANSTAYAGQKKILGGDAALVGYVDSAMVKNNESAKAVEKYLQETGPIQLAASFEKAGVRFAAKGLLSVPEDQLASTSTWLSAKALTLPNKLPKETFAYLAFSSQMKTGKEARDELYKNLAKESTTAGLQKQVEEGERALGIDVVTIFDAIGDEGVIAAAARDGFKYDPATTPSFDDVAVIYTQKVRDLAAAKRLTAVLKSKVSGGPFKLQANGDDFVIEGEKSMPRGELRFVGSNLVAVVGSRDLADRTFAALSGKNTLGDDRAHVAATEPLKAKHVLFWVDLGRVGETALAGMPKLKEQAQAMGIDVGTVRLAGEHRATGAIALNFAAKDKKLEYTLDSINLPLGTAMIAALSPKHSHGSDDPDAKLGAPATRGFGSGKTLGRSEPAGRAGTASLTSASVAGAGDDLPPQCLAALDRYDRCIYKNVSSATRPKMIRTLRETMIKQQPQFRVSTCQGLLDGADRASPNCK